MTVVCEAGSHIVLPGDLYGGTYRLVDKVLARWGSGMTWLTNRTSQALQDAVRSDTRLIWVESRPTRC